MGLEAANPLGKSALGQAEAISKSPNLLIEGWGWTVREQVELLRAGRTDQPRKRRRKEERGGRKGGHMWNRMPRNPYTTRS